MSQFKTYAKLAKERMKNGFWLEAKQQLQHSREVAATMGMDAGKVTQEQRQRMVRMINSPEQYQEEEQFYARVVDIMSRSDTVTNPLALLADQQLVATMSPYDKQAYYLRLSTRYQQAVDRYHLSIKMQYNSSNNT